MPPLSPSFIIMRPASPRIASISAMNVIVWPFIAALCMAVRPLSSFLHISAPDLNSILTIFVWPSSAAT